MPLRRQPIQAPSVPSAIAPQMPRPPSQILSASIGCLPAVEVQLGVGDHVVEPAADDAEHDRPAGDVPDVLGLAAALAPSADGEPQGDQMPATMHSA